MKEMKMLKFPNQDEPYEIVDAYVREQIAAFASEQLSTIMSAIYPIGSIYITTSSTSPSILFGFGTWEQIKDTFLLSAGDTYEAGSTGGEAEHTLVYEKLPEVNGAIVMHNASSINQETYRNGGTILKADTVSIGKIDYSNSGENQPHNNIPPYLAVYMWKRIE